jgi:hypothetical protein
MSHALRGPPPACSPATSSSILQPRPPCFGTGDHVLHAPATTSSMLRWPPPPCPGDHFLHTATVPDDQT